jgi:sentrin-specific protease 1
MKSITLKMIEIDFSFFFFFSLHTPSLPDQWSLSVSNHHKTQKNNMIVNFGAEDQTMIIADYLDDMLGKDTLVQEIKGNDVLNGETLSRIIANQDLGKELPKKRTLPGHLKNTFLNEFSKLQVVDKFAITLTRHSFAKLGRGEWLDDQIINFYFKLLQELKDADSSIIRKSVFFSTFLMQVLFVETNKFDYKAVERWTKKINIFEHDMLFIPINYNQDHWLLAVVYMQQKMIVLYDSMGSSTKKELFKGVLMNWLQLEKETKHPEVHFDASEWHSCFGGFHVPKQSNGYDCGVFVCMAAEYISKNIPLTWYYQDDVNNFRLRMAYYILRTSMLVVVPVIPVMLNNEVDGNNDCALVESRAALRVVINLEGGEGNQEAETVPMTADHQDMISESSTTFNPVTAENNEATDDKKDSNINSPEMECVSEEVIDKSVTEPNISSVENRADGSVETAVTSSVEETAVSSVEVTAVTSIETAVRSVEETAEVVLITTVKDKKGKKKGK